MLIEVGSIYKTQNKIHEANSQGKKINKIYDSNNDKKFK